MGRWGLSPEPTGPGSLVFPHGSQGVLPASCYFHTFPSRPPPFHRVNDMLSAEKGQLLSGESASRRSAHCIQAEPARHLLCAGSSWRLCVVGPVLTLNGQSGISRGPRVFQRVSRNALAWGWHHIGQNAAGESKAGSLWNCPQTSSNVPAQSRRFWYHRSCGET